MTQRSPRSPEQAHKESTGCTGKRSRTGFVPLSEFDERALLSDYRFLEEAAAAGEAAHRVAPAQRRAMPPPHLQELVHQARNRGVALHLQHPGMERRARNSSCFNRRERRLRWHVEWRFPAVGFAAVDKRVDEGRPLGELLSKHLALTPGGAEKAHRLREYADAGANTLTIVMRQELRPANDPAFYRLPPSLPLAGALRGKTLVEFPGLKINRAVVLSREVLLWYL
ncbi:hypothetical protein WJX81_005212 [Elliptochloris bilobata]|uniref:BCD1 alpha/beta domain-containing protein n=1 Tax=Elliptochloris bilobata TaxID=381761 RepID=A0AAW1RLH4_9CHLO